MSDEKSRECFDYLKNIAINTGLSINNHNILASRYDKIGFIRADSIMSSFLSGKRTEKQECKRGSNIYPFGFNIS